MNGCIYKLKDGRCDKPGKYMAFCIGEACASQTPSNYDRIVSMTPEELAEWICCHITECARCEGRCYDGQECEFRNGHSTGLLRWLKSPVEVDDG